MAVQKRETTWKQQTSRVRYVGGCNVDGTSFRVVFRGSQQEKQAFWGSLVSPACQGKPSGVPEHHPFFGSLFCETKQRCHVQTRLAARVATTPKVLFVSCYSCNHGLMSRQVKGTSRSGRLWSTFKTNQQTYILLCTATGQVGRWHGSWLNQQLVSISRQLLLSRLVGLQTRAGTQGYCLRGNWNLSSAESLGACYLLPKT